MSLHLSARFRRARVLTGLLFAAACSNDITAPPPAGLKPQASSASTLTDAIAALKAYFDTAVLERTTPLAQAITVSKTIGKAGGTLEIPEAGFQLVIPKGAVSRNTVFTVTALAGKAIAYEFGPHGVTFAKPLQFRQNAGHTTGWWNASAGGYFKSADQVDTNGLKASVDETMSLRWDGFWMVLDIWHFSGYLVSCA